MVRRDAQFSDRASIIPDFRVVPALASLFSRFDLHLVLHEVRDLV